MVQWEYAEVWYEQKMMAVRVVVNTFSLRGNNQQEHSGKEWGNVLARMGAEGWELVSVMASPTGTHQYWYYFKRPIA